MRGEDERVCTRIVAGSDKTTNRPASLQPGLLPLIRNNIHDDALPLFNSGGRDYRANRFRDPPLLADDFADIVGMNGKLVHQASRVFLDLNLHVFRMIHECSGDNPNQLFHGSTLRY